MIPTPPKPRFLRPDRKEGFPHTRKFAADALRAVRRAGCPRAWTYYEAALLLRARHCILAAEAMEWRGQWG